MSKIINPIKGRIKFPSPQGLFLTLFVWGIPHWPFLPFYIILEKILGKKLVFKINYLVRLYAWLMGNIVVWVDHRSRFRFIPFDKNNSLERDNYIYLEKSRKEGKPFVIVSNHLSAMDIIYFNMTHPWAAQVSKYSIKKNPFFGWQGIMHGNIFLKKGGSSEVLKQRLEDGGSLIIYPEGTRRKEDGLPESFRTGAFVAALDSGADVLVVALSDMPNNKGKRIIKVKEVGILKSTDYNDPKVMSNAALEIIKNYLNTEIRKEDYV